MNMIITQLLHSETYVKTLQIFDVTHYLEHIFITKKAQTQFIASHYKRI